MGPTGGGRPRARCELRAGSRGFSLIELMVVVVIISLATAIAIPLLQDAVQRGRNAGMRADGKKLYHALMSYNADQGKFPSEDELDTETLEPLSNNGYFPAPEAFTSKLLDDAVTLYLAPDVGGDDRHFIAILRAAADPGIIGAVVYTDIIGATGGWVDGVYIISEGELAEAAEDLE